MTIRPELEQLPEEVLKEHLELSERLQEIERVENAQSKFLSLSKPNGHRSWKVLTINRWQKPLTV